MCTKVFRYSIEPNTIRYSVFNWPNIRCLNTEYRIYSEYRTECYVIIFDLFSTSWLIMTSMYDWLIVSLRGTCRFFRGTWTLVRGMLRFLKGNRGLHRGMLGLIRGTGRIPRGTDTVLRGTGRIPRGTCGLLSLTCG